MGKEKKYAEKLRSKPDSAQQRAGAAMLLNICALLFLGAVCLTSASTVKMAVLTLTALTLASVFLFFSKLRGRIGAPLLLLAAVVVMDGVSTLYAVSGKFALYEFLKVLAAFCLALLLLAYAPGKDTGRWIAKVLSGASAIAGLVSIDLLSTRLFSGLVLKVLAVFTPDYGDLAGVEAGVRMTSLFGNPNVFAGIAGLGVLLSLGLAASSKAGAERTAQTAILYINSLAFLLAFSMGASGSIAVAFAAFLLLTRKERRTGLLILMAETLVSTVLAAAVISMTSFQPWKGIQPVPALCTVLGAAALCALDRAFGLRLTRLLEQRRKAVPVLGAALLAALAVFVLATYHLTGPAALEAGGTLRRAAYPDPGAYSLSVESDRPLDLTVESQDQRETMMHTSTVLYSGPASDAAFDVPEGSLVVYFNFAAPEGADIRSAAYAGENGTGRIPLGYKLLPGFIANRLQGLWANENAIQRFVFFADGLKLFLRSPVIGLGMGAFENGVKSVQSFSYATKYAHNHYIQTLAETGVIGLFLFLLLLGGCTAAVVLDRKRAENMYPLTPALGAALVFMACHAATEVVFSTHPYLPMAFGVFALISLCCADALPRPALGVKGQTVSLLTMSVLMVIYAVLLVCNLHAGAVAEAGNSFEALDEAIALDRFEWADYALSYVDSVSGQDVGEDILSRADKYARRLAELDSNTVPIHLAGYYFQTGRTEEAVAMVEKYVGYVSSDAAAWQQAFDLLMRFEEDSDAYRAGVRRTAEMLAQWNAENMEEITVNAEAQALIARAGG